MQMTDCIMTMSPFTNFFSDKLGQLIPPKMTQSKRKNDFIRRILEQYEQISKEDISDHTVSFF